MSLNGGLYNLSMLMIRSSLGLSSWLLFPVDDRPKPVDVAHHPLWELLVDLPPVFEKLSVWKFGVIAHDRVRRQSDRRWSGDNYRFGTIWSLFNSLNIVSPWVSPGAFQLTLTTCWGAFRRPLRALCGCIGRCWHLLYFYTMRVVAVNPNACYSLCV